MKGCLHGVKKNVEAGPRHIFAMGLLQIHPQPSQDQSPRSIGPLNITKSGLKLPQGPIGQSKVGNIQIVLFISGHLNSHQNGLQAKGRGGASKDTAIKPANRNPAK